MSTVIVDVDNQYCDELCYSYQIVQEDNGTYTVYQARSVLKGKYLARNLESFQLAWDVLNESMKYEEFSFA